MKREQIIAFIENTVAANASFQQAFEELESLLKSLPKSEISTMLLECGIIPEAFNHDSTQEKLWAKYCDLLLSAALNSLGIESSVIRTRGNAADVLGQAQDYTIVADAKAFRLSRTAKNQKDFKVSALDDWRRTNTFACLVAPLYQYPAQSSQIYTQAKSKNVTLLSYVHLSFLLNYAPKASLIELWRVAGSLNLEGNAQAYWAAIDTLVTDLATTHMDILQEYKQREMNIVRTIGRESIAYWQSVIETYQTLSREEAVKRLIRAEKIEQKIEIIRKAIVELQDTYE